MPDFTARFQTQSFPFSNVKAYRHYRWTVTATRTPNGCCMQVAEVELLGSILPPDVTQPGDPIIASSSNSPGSEGVANVIDGKPTKYLNFDSRNTTDPIKPSGFVVSPSIGRTLITGMNIESANDGPERDPKTVTLEGSNDATVTGFSDGNWEAITTINVPDFAARFQTQTFLFDNYKPYRHYRWTTTATRTPNGCCMQVAEVELLGTGAPKDVTQPGDPIIASSSNSPGSEGVANVIDGKPTKYLNFDSRNTTDPIKPSGFVVTPSIGVTAVIGMTIQSANDGPERDPKTVILEGSNDAVIADFNSGNWTPIATIDVPDFTARFQTQEFYFPNQNSYKSYRWTVTATRTPNGCCMQVAEVELLAVPAGVDCSKTKFLTQPVNTPVLEGSTATLFAVVNGPWPLQWSKNGQPIPSASSASYTTDPITAANANDVYAVTIVGCEKSTDVQAILFTPSATESVGVSFAGGGANGAPTSINDDDVMGIQLQAHWNNAAGGSGSLAPVNSSGDQSSITFDWATGGAWGAGTGDNSAINRMLNGLVGRNVAGQNTFTFGNVPDGSHSLLVYAVGPPLQFQTVSFNVGGTTYYMRTMNSDEYNAAPGFYRGFSTDSKSPTVGNFVRFDNLTADVNGAIVLTTETLTTGFDRQTGVNGLQLVLNAVPPGDPPVIVVDPQPTVAAGGAVARLSVSATGQGLTYQWRKNGRNLADGGNITGATTRNLSIGEFSPPDAAVYSVAVFNAAGSVISKNAAVSVSLYSINDRLVGYWKYDETAGTTAANSIAGGQPGEVVGNGAWVPGQVGNAIALDGASYVLVPDYSKAKAAISGSCWVNIDPSTATDVALFRNAEGAMIVSGGTVRVVGQFEVGLVYDSGDGSLHPLATVGIGPNLARGIGAAAFPLNSWHFIAFSADGAQLRLYVDGAEVAVVDYLADINPPDIAYISMGARLGLDSSQPPVLGPDTIPNYLLGGLDDVALWTRALSAEEVGLTYAAGVAHKAVTTVVVPQPAVVPRLTVRKVGNIVTVTFDAGKLQSATRLNPANWADVPNANSPYSEVAGARVKFFRAVVP